MRKQAGYRESELLAYALAEIELLKSSLFRLSDGRQLVLAPGSSTGTTPAVEAAGHVLYGSKHTKSLRVTAGSGLSVDYEDGAALINGVYYPVGAGTLAGLTDNTTNYIFVDSSGDPAANDTGFPAACVQLAEVTTVDGEAAVINDRRAYLSSGHPQLHDHSVVADGQTLQPLNYKWPVPTTLTIDAGLITVTQGCHIIRTEDGDPTDDLIGINGMEDNQWYLFRIFGPGEAIVIKHNVMNLLCQGDADIHLASMQDFVLVYNVAGVGGYVMGPLDAALAADVSYTPNIGPNWDPDDPPEWVDEALDILIARIVDLEAGAGHDPVSLDADASGVLSLVDQELGLEEQVANTIFAGPVTGAPDIPGFRVLVAADLGSGAPSGAKYLRDDLSWQEPAGGPGGGGDDVLTLAYAAAL
jgi:hypothetical protein